MTQEITNIEEAPYWVLAYYHFTAIKDPHEEVNIHKAFLEPLDAASRIYISNEGVNGQMSALKEDAIKYMEWMLSRPEFNTVKFKIHGHHENVFPRKTIKFKKQLVAIDTDVDMSLTGEHVSPEKWEHMLEDSEDRILIDVRNDYEWKLGRFQGAELPQCETFRDFMDYADDLKTKNDPESTPVMMYCTGGIRCEIYSAILKKNGFKHVYQLDGGVIGYGLKRGSKHWQGKLFAFDDRLAIPIADGEQSPVIGTCHHCGTSNDHYYNCANMDCNHLFLCCPTCLKEHDGCCSAHCKNSPRLRPFHEQNPHKPFKKWYHYERDLKPGSMDHKKKKSTMQREE